MLFLVLVSVEYLLYWLFFWNGFEFLFGIFLISRGQKFSFVCVFELWIRARWRRAMGRRKAVDLEVKSRQEKNVWDCINLIFWKYDYSSMVGRTSLFTSLQACQRRFMCSFWSYRIVFCFLLFFCFYFLNGCPMMFRECCRSWSEISSRKFQDWTFELITLGHAQNRRWGMKVEWSKNNQQKHGRKLLLYIPTVSESKQRQRIHSLIHIITKAS